MSSHPNAYTDRHLQPWKTTQFHMEQPIHRSIERHRIQAEIINVANNHRLFTDHSTCSTPITHTANSSNGTTTDTSSLNRTNSRTLLNQPTSTVYQPRQPPPSQFRSARPANRTPLPSHSPEQISNSEPKPMCSPAPDHRTPPSFLPSNTIIGSSSAFSLHH